MTADNTHAERQMLKRAIAYYDRVCAENMPEPLAREIAYRTLGRNTGRDEIEAAQLLADALARRASLKPENTHGTP